jgi:hypothetical protein
MALLWDTTRSLVSKPRRFASCLNVQVSTPSPTFPQPHVRPLVRLLHRANSRRTDACPSRSSLNQLITSGTGPRMYSLSAVSAFNEGLSDEVPLGVLS